MSDERALPELRQDLRLQAGPATFFGAPTWLIYDPVRHRYFSISNKAHDVLVLWTSGGSDAVQQWIDDDRNEIDHRSSLLENLIVFLQANNLTTDPADDDYRSYVAQFEANKENIFLQAIHKYLFFRVPLCRPQRFLERTKKYIAPLCSDSFLFLLVALGVSGLYFVSRQWDEFISTFLHFISFEGAVIYGLSLIVVKTLHELGHAYMAVRNGARVNTMGVAFLLMFPILYTDVSDSWRLSSRRQKFLIDAAGIMVELSVAIIATFLWVFLPEGALKSAAFVLATTSWILSLAINLNPFMKFDAYYMLSDVWGIANLQGRAFEFGRWWIREVLFGVGMMPPEPLPKRTRRLLVAYAIGVWIYRFILFIGIALLVYYFFFKVLGIILFTIEVIWFIGLPVAKEVGEWWKMRNSILVKRRIYVTASIFCSLIILAFLPIGSTIRLPAVMMAKDKIHVHAPRAGFIEDVKIVDGQQVRRGDVMFQLSAPDLDHQLTQVERRIALLNARNLRRASDVDERQNSFVVMEELAAAEEEAAGLRREKERLTILAPRDGIVRDIDRTVHAGRWIDEKTELALVVGSGGVLAKAIVDEDNLWRLDQGAVGRFIADDPLRSSQDVRIVEIAYSGTRNLEIPYLASTFGGPVAVERDADDTLRPVTGSYLVTFDAPKTGWLQATRGVIHVEGAAESFASAIQRQVMRVFVREAGV